VPSSRWAAASYLVRSVRLQRDSPSALDEGLQSIERDVPLIGDVIETAAAPSPGGGVSSSQICSRPVPDVSRQPRPTTTR
jgi:hypothetical protein